MPENIIDELSIRIVADAKSAINALREAESALVGIKNAAIATGNIKLKSFASDAALTQAKKLADVLSGLDENKAKTFSSAITSIANADTAGIKEVAASAKGIAQLTAATEVSPRPLLQLISALNMMDVSGVDNLAEAAKGLREFNALATMSKADSGKHIAQAFSSIESIDTGKLIELSFASQGLGKNFSSLASLSRSGGDKLQQAFEVISNVDVNNVSALAEASKGLGNAFSSLSSLSRAGGKGLEEAFRAFESANEEKIHGVAESAKGLSQSFSSIASMARSGGKGLTEAFSALESVDTTQISILAVSAEGLSQSFSSIASMARTGGEKLTEAFNAIESADAVKIREVAVASEGLGKNFASIASMARTDGKSLPVIFDALDNANLAPLVRLGSAAEGLKNLAPLSSLLRVSADSVKELFAALNREVNFSILERLSQIDFSNMKDLADASRVIKRLSDRLKETGKSGQEAASGIKATNKEAKKSNGIFSRIGKSIGGLFKSIARIAFYRAIRSMIKSFTQGLSEGMKNLYYWSQAWGTSFHTSMDQLATSSQYLKNSFAAMFSPLIEKAIPIIDALIDKFVDFFNFVQEGFAQLTGAETWNRAKKVPATWQEALDDASASAKELKHQLMGFDELNVLNTPSAGRGNSNKDEKDYSSMFELVETAAGDNFESIGEKLADALNKVFEDPEEWGEKGKGLATAITDGFNEGLDFFNGVDWVKVGESVSTFISEFVSRIAGWIKDEEPLSEAITALTNAVCGVIEGIDVLELLKSFAKLFLSLSASLPSVILASLASAMKVIGTLLKKVGLKTSGAAMLYGADKITEVRKKYDAWNSEKLGIVFDVMDNGFENYIPKDLEGEEDSELKLGIDIEPEFEGEPTTLTGIQKAFNAFFQGLKTIFVFPIVIRLVQKLQEIDWEEVKAKLKKKTLEVAIKVINITKALASAWATIKEKWGERKVVIKANFITITKAVADGWAKIKEKWGERFVNVKTKFTELKKAAESAWGEIVKIWGNPELSVSTKIEYSFQLLSKSLSKLWEDVKKLWGEKKLSIKAFFENIKLPHFKITDQGGGSNYTWNLVKWVSDKNAIPKLAIDWYAQGGFINPSSYSLAGLGENGVPEILGTVGGRSAVAGGAEITGIRQAILEQGQREENLLRSLISAVNGKDLTLVANSNTGRWVSRALNAYAGVTG